MIPWCRLGLNLDDRLDKIRSDFFEERVVVEPADGHHLVQATPEAQNRQLFEFHGFVDFIPGRIDLPNFSVVDEKDGDKFFTVCPFVHLDHLPAKPAAIRVLCDDLLKKDFTKLSKELKN